MADDTALLPAALASIAPVAFGFAAVHLRMFVESREEFRRRVALKKKEYAETLAIKHVAVLRHIVTVTAKPDEPFRGDGVNAPDLVGDLATNSIRLHALIRRLDQIKSGVDIAYSALWVSVVLGASAFFVALLSTPSRTCVLWCGIALVAVQAVIVRLLYTASSRLEVYEDVA